MLEAAPFGKKQKLQLLFEKIWYIIQAILVFGLLNTAIVLGDL